MLRRIFGVFLIVAIATAFGAMLGGCESRPAAALKLFEKGEYQQVIDKYPDLEIARRARAKIADSLLKDKKFDQVIREYPDTPASYKAKEGLAQMLFDQGNYQAILDSFPGASVASMAKQRLADTLFAKAEYDLLMQKYPDTPKAQQVKEERAAADLAKAKRLRGTAKEEALSNITRMYAGTAAQKEANELLSEIRRAKTPPPKKK